MEVLRLVARGMNNRDIARELFISENTVKNHVRNILDKLPTHEFAAVLLRFQQGFTFEDMATICNEKPGTLEAWVMRAMSELRTCIERRIEDALAQLGAEHEPPPGWEARVLAATHVTRRRPWWYAAGGLAAAVAAQAILIHGWLAVDHVSAATIAADTPGWITKR
jgi:predicted DNA-binding protein (UPF0251 family)